MGFNIVSKRANVFENGAGFFAFCCKRHAEALFECKAKFKRINAVKAESFAKERFIGINIFGLDVFERSDSTIRCCSSLIRGLSMAGLIL